MTWTAALFLAISLLSVVGYNSVRRDCQTTDNYLTDERGNILTDERGNGLTAETRTRQCQLIVANERIPLPAWTE